MNTQNKKTHRLQNPNDPKVFFYQKWWNTFKKFTIEDWVKIGFKLFFGIFTFAVIMTFWIIGLVNLQFKTIIGNKTNYDYYSIDGNTFSIHFFSFFTIQTCLFSALYWILSGLFHTKEGKWKILSQQATLMFTIYITITGIVFNTMLLPTIKGVSSATWFQLMWEHTVVPILFILWFLFWFNGRVKTDLKNFLKYKVWYTIIYPFAWMIYALTSGYLKSYGNYIATNESFHHPPIKYFNYFFINLSGTHFGIPGYVWFIFALIFVLGIIIGFSALFIYIINQIIKKDFYLTWAKKN